MANITLVGPDQQDNMALRYLSGAATSAGHQVTFLRFNNRGDLGHVVAQVCQTNFDLLGFGMSFQYAISLCAGWLDWSGAMGRRSCVAKPERH